MGDEELKKENTEPTPEAKLDGNPPGDDEDSEGTQGTEGLSLDMAPNSMTARLEIALENAQNFSPDDIVDYLKTNNISEDRIKMDQVNRFFDDSIFNRALVVAKGIPPKAGDDGKVEWEIDLSVLDGAALTERGGRVDWKDQHHILQVAENELLATIIEPTEGEPGQDIFGRELPTKPGKPAKFRVGKGIRVSEDGTEIYTEIGGVICREDNKISVSNIYNVQGDVDFKTGNVDYDETIVITGGVLTDFEVKAGKDCHVNGLVEGAKITAGGSIFINGGIQGDQKAHLHAGGEVTAKFVNSATIEAKGNVTITGSITNSIVKAGDRVIAEGDKSVIVGGHIMAEREVRAAVLGSEIGVKTKIDIGVNFRKVIERRGEAQEQVKTLVENFKKLKQVTKTLNQLRDKGKLNKEQDAMRMKVTRSSLQLQAQIKKLNQEIDALKQEIDRARNEITGVVAKNIAWPGVHISILNNPLIVRAQTTKAIFAYTDHDIEVFAYKESDAKKKKSKDSPDDDS